MRIPWLPFHDTLARYLRLELHVKLDHHAIDAYVRA